MTRRYQINKRQVAVSRVASRRDYVSFLLITACCFLALVFLAIQPAAAAQRNAADINPQFVECAVDVFGQIDPSGLSGCGEGVFLPSSMGFKCNLYEERGYPSDLFKKICVLFGSGYIENVLEGLSSSQ